MIDVALYEPEIPPNTGNAMRLCANTGARLHLIQPLGFALDDARMRRAGLDYRDQATIVLHADFAAFRAAMSGRRLLALSTRGSRRHDQIRYEEGDVLLFGPETRGLSQALLDELGPEHCLRLPMRPGSRSLNLSNSVAVVVYEAWRQSDFAGGA
jgi:tRNA (cytidine/uridine-2'-O-)-methyltransferase